MGGEGRTNKAVEGFCEQDNAFVQAARAYCQPVREQFRVALDDLAVEPWKEMRGGGGLNAIMESQEGNTCSNQDGTLWDLGPSRSTLFAMTGSSFQGKVVCFSQRLQAASLHHLFLSTGDAEAWTQDLLHTYVLGCLERCCPWCDITELTAGL